MESSFSHDVISTKVVVVRAKFHYNGAYPKVQVNSSHTLQSALHFVVINVKLHSKSSWSGTVAGKTLCLRLSLAVNT